MQKQKIDTFFQEVSLKENETLKRLWTHNAHGRYFVSNQGRVFSLCMSEWHELEIQYYANGYAYVSLWYHGDKENVCVHRLVAESFVFNPYEGMKDIQIHHKDYNRQNNAFYNLQFMTEEEHKMIHAIHRKELREQKKHSGKL